MTQIALLPHRGVLELTGLDRVSFLNGLVSNDISKAAPGHAIWAALLTPQGRYLFDFFAFADADRLLLELPRQQIPALMQKLRRFKLRAEVEISDRSAQFHVHALWGGISPLAPLTAEDPRLPQAGARCLAANLLDTSATLDDYAAHRIALGLPDGSPDLEPEKTLLLEAGFDELNGVDWQKGCYMGQELTARTKYRGLVKRRLLPVTLSQPCPVAGTPILAGDQEVGNLRSSVGNQALAMLQISALNQSLSADGIPLTVNIPSWLRLPGVSAS